MFRMITLPFKLVFLVLAIISFSILWYQTKLSILALSRIDPLPETRDMLEDNKYAEASDYLMFFMSYEYVNENPEAQKLHKEISSKRSSWSYQLDKLGEGLISGTSDEAIGQAAGVATDFFVVGDIRDLTKQGVNLAKGEEVDQVLVALATLGVVATAAQVASVAGTAATGGAAAPAVAGTTVTKSALIALKAARKLGKMPPWLGEAMIKAAKTAKQSKSLASVTGLLADVNTLAKTRGGFKILGQAKNATDLRRMAKFADTFGSESAAMYRVGGDVVVDVAQRANKLGKEPIKLATTFGQNGLKLLDKVGVFKFTKSVSRVSKMAYKGDIFHLLAMLLLMLPTWVLYLFVAIGAAMWVPWRMLAALSRWRYRYFNKTAKVTSSGEKT